MNKLFLAIVLAATTFASCKQTPEQPVAILNETSRLVTLSGTLTEVVSALGFESNIVGVDVTSTFPQSVLKLPKAGHTRNLSAEGVLSMNPTVVFAYEGEILPELQQQLETAGSKLYLFPTPKNIEESKALIQSLADTLGVAEKAQDLIQNIDAKVAQIQPLATKPKVLFIYARGAGMLMVAGDHTPIKSIIELAGGQNAVGGFEEFKPLSPEVLVEANPDVILIFDSGLSSLEGEAGLKLIPGMDKTNAAKNNAFIAMDGQFLNGFSPRVGDAVLELHQKLQTVLAPK